MEEITKTIKAKEIENGMIINVQGHWMEARNVKHIKCHDGRNGTYFNGYLVDKNDPTYRTIYNGGDYGSVDDYNWIILIK